MTAEPVHPIRVTDRTGRTGRIICFYDEPEPVALVVWDKGNYTWFPASKFADLTAVKA